MIPKCPIDNSRLKQNQITVNDSGFLIKKWVWVCYQHGVTEINLHKTEQLKLDGLVNKCEKDGSGEKICISFISPEPGVPFTSERIRNFVCEFDGHLFTCHYPCKKCDLQYPSCPSMAFTDDIHYSKNYDSRCVNCFHEPNCHGFLNEEHPLFLMLTQKTKQERKNWKINKLTGKFENELDISFKIKT